MRFLFTTLQYIESDFYGRVGAELERRGHEVAHVTISRQAADDLRSRGAVAYCLPDEVAAQSLDQLDVEAGAIRVEREYDVPTLRDVYRTDRACHGRPEDWCVARTVGQFVALERIFDEVRPDLVVPEVGCETLRTAAHLIARRHQTPTLFLFYTIFDRPLRLCVDTMDAPIVTPGELHQLDDDEREEVEQFIRSFIARDEPIRPYHQPSLSPTLARNLKRHLIVRARHDRDNEYLRPGQWLAERLVSRFRKLAAKPLYKKIPAERPFVYFPLHVVDDYKVQRVTPHLYDQASVVRQVARALPHGYDLVIKEHPMSIGRNSLAMLRELRREPNIRLVAATTSSHELIRRAQAIVVIGSTVGLEALLHFKPVLTIGQPFFAGAGVTLDVGSTVQLREAVPRVLGFQPDRESVLRFLHAAMDRCWPGAPVLVDRSDENAVEVAATLDAAHVGASSRPDGGSLSRNGASRGLRHSGAARTPRGKSDRART